MSTLRYIIGIALLLTGVLPANSQVSNDNEDEVNKVDTRFVEQDFLPGQVLVKFKDSNRVNVRRVQGRFASTNIDKVTSVLKKFGVSEMEQLLPNENPNRQLRRARAYNGDVIQERDLSQLYCLTLSAEHQQETTQAVEELKTLDEVEFAEPNYRVYAMADTHIADDYSGNPMEGQQWYLDSYGVKELWDKPIINPERPIIAILDTGVDLTHPDLKDNLWTNAIEQYGIKDNDNDGNGFKNDVYGWDFVNNSPNIRDNNMHGTHVAGIAAAANNGIGIVGANPQALIMPITVLQSDGAGDVATIVKGIDYAVNNGATIINMSLGLYSNSNVLRQTLVNAYNKAVLVAAAGNDGFSICLQHRRSKKDLLCQCFPAAYSFVLGVQATDIFNELTDWSNYDNDGPLFSCNTSVTDPDGFNYEIKAPGRNILSTIPGGNYKQLNGTSMAAPLVAGAISALKMVKEYENQEILWADLLHTNTIAEAYQLADRPAELELQRVVLHERKDASELSEEEFSGDNEVDAGEIVCLYPVIRSTFGDADNINLKLEIGEFEDPDVIEIVDGNVNFGFHLDAFGKGVSKNPLIFKVPKGIADGRIVKLKIIVTCDNNSKSIVCPFTILVHNMIKINGLINEDRTLTADHIYYVNGDLGINKGSTLTIEPGTRLEFAEGKVLVSFGNLVANGTKERPIIFTKHAGEGAWGGIYSHWNEGEHKENGGCIYRNNDSTLFTFKPTDVTPYIMYNPQRYVYYSEGNYPNRYFKLLDYMPEGETFNMNGRESLLENPSFITPAVKEMLEDFEEYCNSYSSKQTDECNLSSWVSCTFSGWVCYDHPIDTLSFSRIEDCNSTLSIHFPAPYMRDCLLTRVNYRYSSGTRNVIQSDVVCPYDSYSNYVNNNISFGYAGMNRHNLINNFSKKNGKLYTLLVESDQLTVEHSDYPSYLGTSREDLIRPYIYELGNGKGTWGTLDLSNMPKEPYSEAHGIVWKVCVNGKDAQDEFEDLAPLGIGKHKFEVYFNRPMNKAVIPQISFGVRDPYTQNAVVEDGSWNEEGTIYTAYKTITGKTMSDGLNRIYVQGAEDNEYIPCPYEKTRFNVIIQAAGSMATGFMAEEGLGRVKLKWDQLSNQQEDALGYNVYRYHQETLPAGYRNGSWHSEEIVNDTVKLNVDILDIETTAFIDYNVTPGVTYYYFYKLLSTDLQAMDMSNTVAATPRTSTRGDANASGDVDVADVITTVNYITKQNPKPFIFEAADMNTDNIIDILDVMGIVKGILNPSLLASASAEQTATYIIEDGTLYVESPVSLAGIQIQLSLSEELRVKSEEFATADDLNGFECASAWLSDNDYLFLAYSMNGKTLSPGKHALLHIGDALIASMRLSDANGHNVEVIGDDATKVNRMASDVMSVPGIYDLKGRKLTGDSSLERKLPKGVYIINGRKVVR